MTLTVTHTFVSVIADGGDTSLVQPSNWNANHSFSGVLPVANGGTGVAYFTVAGPTGTQTYTFPDASVSISQLGAETWTGDKTLAENVGIALDPALSATGKYSGIVEGGTAGAALAFGEVCYLAVADTRWEKAKADVSATSFGKLGICVLAAAGDGSATTMLLFGKIRADALFPAMTVGAPVYLSAATAGEVTSTAPAGTPGFIVRKLGFANTADELYWTPSNDYTTIP